ncbi:MAG: hypothetical protein Q7S74_01245, partial [Nanoarchaeota archaeon]|nr:hypothetical protein [Nanoarchaeota archaeon]
ANTARVYTIRKAREGNSKETNAGKKESVRESKLGGLFLVGKKEEANLIVLKSDSANNPLFKEAYGKILEDARKNRAHVNEENDHAIILFSPSLGNASEMNAVQFAQNAESILKDYNKRAREKVNFGISLNQGSIIAENDRGQFRFTSIGNIVSRGKKIAETAKQNNELLLSDTIYKKVMASVKCDKVSDDAWRINRIVQRDKYDSFIGKFMKRNDSP